MTTTDMPVPWPGPRPYDEGEWRIFFGRTKEINDVRRRIVAHRLSILSGASGAGKTSLLRAGVVPLLRLQRYKVKDKERGQGADSGEMEWPVLVLRDWGTAKGMDIPQMIRSQMKEAAQALEGWESERARQDREIIVSVVSSMPSDAEIVDIVQEICSRTDGLIIIFDQLEEILRAGEQTAKRITDIIRDLFESGLPLKLLLSLRIEHIADLRSLESLVGGLVARTLFLAPMGREGVKQVVQSVCRAANATIPPDLVSRVLEWLSVAEEQRRRQIALDDADASGTPSDHPDLLALQAILYELFSMATSRPGAVIDIDEDVVTAYIGGYGVDQASIAAKALQRWITRALEWTSEREIDLSVSEPALTKLIYRIAVRLAPHLSSGDYKVAQEQSDLFRKALGNEIWALGLRHPELRRMIRIVDKSTHLNTYDLGLSEQFDERVAGFLSGVALENEWSPSRTAHVLLGCYRETLGRLQRGNIIKPIFSPSGESVDQARSWELVHDRLGRAFADWAEEQRDTWEDCVASLVASRGISPIMITNRLSAMDGVVEEAIRHVRWEGCVVAPLEGRAFFRRVKFSSCHLRGSIFERCTFIGGEFSGCDLNGVLFRDCEFRADEDGEGLVVKQCNSASLGILYSRSCALKFVDCKLTQFTLKKVDLEGAIAFEGTKVFLGYFGEVGAGASQRWLTFDPASGIYHCSGDVSSWRLLHLEPGCEQINSSPALA